MKSYKPLQEAFNQLDSSTVQWFKHSRFPKSMETANTVLYRNLPVDGSTLAYLAHCLGMTNAKIITILEAYAKETPKKESEVAVLKKLIAPVDLTESEQDLIKRLRKLDPAKRKLIEDMAGAL